MLCCALMCRSLCGCVCWSGCVLDCRLEEQLLYTVIIPITPEVLHLTPFYQVNETHTQH